MVRCFIGIFIPSELRSKIVFIQEQLKKTPIRAKMVEPENLHICLSFLGEIKESEIKGISNSLDFICKRYEKFKVKISGIKFIPSENYIRVLALDVKNGILETIRKNIVNEIGGDSKPPHVTLCRVKGIEDKLNTIRKIKEINYEIGDFIVKEISLIKSVIRRAGPVYTVLHQSSLL
jgi:2'-5' RNA ligase